MRCAVPFQVKRASTWEPDSAQQPLRQVNPLGQIPTPQFDDSSAMTESAATLIELGLRHPALLVLLQRVESQPDLAPVFARHWTG